MLWLRGWLDLQERVSPPRPPVRMHGTTGTNAHTLLYLLLYQSTKASQPAHSVWSKHPEPKTSWVQYLCSKKVTEEEEKEEDGNFGRQDCFHDRARPRHLAGQSFLVLPNPYHVTNSSPFLSPNSSSEISTLVIFVLGIPIWDALPYQNVCFSYKINWPAPHIL